MGIYRSESAPPDIGLHNNGCMAVSVPVRYGNGIAYAQPECPDGVVRIVLGEVLNGI